MSREQGKVKWFNNKKGFGLLRGFRRMCCSLFGYRRDGYKTLKEGDSVEFTLHRVKGFQAENVAKRELSISDPAIAEVAGSCCLRIML